jgi:hypothetical protein
MWDEEDGFFYDVLRLPDGNAMRVKVRSMVGLLPLAAVSIFEAEDIEKLPNFRKRAAAFLQRHLEFVAKHIPQGIAPMSSHRSKHPVCKAFP